MSRLAIPTYETSPAASQPLLDGVLAQFGVIPNLFRLVGNSTAALQGLLSLHGALGKTLDLKTRERIALAVAEVTGCDYCLSAHSFIAANMAQLDEVEIRANRLGYSIDPRADGAVRLAQQVVRNRGKIEDEALANARAAGLSDAQIVDVVANVALNIFTNLMNNVAQTDIDFPVVHAGTV